MKLVDLIAYFRSGKSFEDFCEAHSLNAGSEVIEIYAQEPVSLESDLGFFPIEETEGKIEHMADGVKYHNLFDFYYFLDVIADVQNGSSSPEDGELAKSLLSYALKDA